MNANLEISSNNKRILKNTFFLYARMLVTMAVSLFTVRVVLQVLGAEDYGINNVVGGVVTMFSFLTSSMVSASQRFFSFSLGQKNYKMLSDYFSLSFWCFIILAVVIVLFSETIGLWLVSNKLSIPIGRFEAAMWLYQFSIVSFVIQILAIPYNSIIIAHEKMNIYALVGLLEVFLKLGIAYLLYISPIDKLKTYGALLLLVNFVTSCIYAIYCLKNFSETKVRRMWSKVMFKEVFGYTSWTMFGAVSSVLRSQGINVLLNIFFNPVVNAARAIAYQVNNALNQFVLNFFKAVQPQITKYYAASEKSELMYLIFRSSRYCYYLMLILSLPVLFEMPFILQLWLKEVPEYTVLFSRLVIITAIVESTAYPLLTALSATGNIKWYQLVTGGLLILTLPISWLCLHWGYPPEITMWISIAIALVSQVCRILFSKKLFEMSIVGYLKEVVFPIGYVTILSVFILFMLELYLSDTIATSLLMIFSSVVISSSLALFLGVPKNERKTLVGIIVNKLRSR